MYIVVRSCIFINKSARCDTHTYDPFCKVQVTRDYIIYTTYSNTVIYKERISKKKELELKEVVLLYRKGMNPIELLLRHIATFHSEARD